MLIRSQNKSGLINFTSTQGMSIGYETLINGDREYKIYCHFNGENNPIQIATYSTEEKAIKVLDMICENYQHLDCLKFDIHFVGGCKSTFVMPQESEVNP